MKGVRVVGDLRQFYCCSVNVLNIHKVHEILIRLPLGVVVLFLSQTPVSVIFESIPVT